MSIATALIAYSLAAALLTLTPGLDTALVLHTAARRGTRAAWLAALGVAAGCLVWGLLAALGLSAVLLTSASLFTALKLLGAAYLVWLGIDLLVRSGRERAEGVAELDGHPFRRGLLTNLLNPKVGLFYVAFLPQFVPAGAPLFAMIVAMTAIHALLSLGWFALLIAATRRAEGLFKRRGVRAWLDRITGGMFLALGLRLALSSR